MEYDHTAILIIQMCMKENDTIWETTVQIHQVPRSMEIVPLFLIYFDKKVGFIAV